MKVGGDNVVQNFEKKFKELRVEGNRKENGVVLSPFMVVLEIK